MRDTRYENIEQVPPQLLLHTREESNMLFLQGVQARATHFLGSKFVMSRILVTTLNHWRNKFSTVFCLQPELTTMDYRHWVGSHELLHWGNVNILKNRVLLRQKCVLVLFQQRS